MASVMQIKCSPLDPNYLIAQRDKFVCQFCGTHRDSEFALDDLTVVQIIPSKFGGSDASENKATACLSCAALKGQRMFFPNADYSMKDADGWHQWRGMQFGKWSMRISPDGGTCCIVNKHYWFDIMDCWKGECINEPYPWGWERQLSQKCWCNRYSGDKDHDEGECDVVDANGLSMALAFARSMVIRPTIQPRK